MSKHTKTPWGIDEYGNVKADRSPCSMQMVGVRGLCLTGGKEAEANARHIVHCVNNHERLVEALRAMMASHKTSGMSNGAIRSAEEQARTLLAELDAGEGGE